MSFVVWFCVVLFDGKSSHHWKNASTLMVCQDSFTPWSRQVTIWQRFPWIIPRLVIYMKHSHTCLAKTSSFVFSQQTKISCRSLKISNHGRTRISHFHELSVQWDQVFLIQLLKSNLFFLPYFIQSCFMSCHSSKSDTYPSSIDASGGLLDPLVEAIGCSRMFKSYLVYVFNQPFDLFLK